VLPLEDLNRDPAQDYFADGMTEALITDLGKLGELRVISRTSAMRYKGVGRALPEIARELDVDAVVVGSVLRAGERVRITAQLVHARSDRHLWAETYERDVSDILELQASVARAIAEEVRQKVMPGAPPGTPRPVDRAAYEAYLRGRYHWNRRTADALLKSIEYFEQAVAADPGLAQAHAAIASSYVIIAAQGVGALAPRDAAPRAKSAARRALALDDGLAEAHAALAYAAATYDWDRAAAEQGFERALSLNPSDATAHFWHAAVLAASGKAAASIEESRRAQALDPVSPIVNAGVAWMLHMARRDDEAIAEARKALALEPEFAIARLRLGLSYIRKGMSREAIAELQAAVRASGGSPDALAALAQAHAAAGEDARARSALAELLALSTRRYVSSYSLATVYASLGESERAFEWLSKACAERSWGLSFAEVAPELDPLRADPRFAELLRCLAPER
jgi:TolB-like protein/Tfp pilus assembly protein PilF